jgi:hypothetical protein
MGAGAGEEGGGGWFTHEIMCIQSGIVQHIYCTVLHMTRYVGGVYTSQCLWVSTKKRTLYFKMTLTFYYRSIIIHHTREYQREVYGYVVFGLLILGGGRLMQRHY